MLALVGKTSIFSFRYFWNRELLTTVSFKLSSLSQFRKFTDTFYSETDEKLGQNKQEILFGRISNLLQEKKYEEVINEIKSIAIQGIELDPQHYISFAKELARRHRFDELLQVFEACPKEKRDQIYPFIIRAYGDVKEISKAQYYFDQVRDHADVWCYAAIMDAQRKSNNHEAVLNLFNELKEKKIAPTTGIYTILLHSFSAQKKITQMLHYLSKMQVDKLSPDSYVYSLILAALTDAGELEKTQSIIDMIQNSDKKLTVSVYTAIMAAFSKRKLPNLMIQFFNEMKSQEITPDLKAYTTLVIGLGEANDMENMIYYMKEMRTVGFKFDVVIFTALLRLYLNRKQMSQFKFTLDWMKKENIELDSWGASVLIRYYCSQKKYEKGLELLQSLKSKNLPLHESCFLPLIKSYLKEGQLKKAEEIYNDMLSRKIIPSPFAVSILINSCNNLDFIHKMVNDARSLKVPKNFAIHGALANAYARKKEYLEVIRLYEDLRDAGTPITYGDLKFLLTALTHFELSGLSSKLVDQFKVLKKKLESSGQWKLENTLGKTENSVFSLLLVAVKRKLQQDLNKPK